MNGSSGSRSNPQETLSGEHLRRMVAAATQVLGHNIEAVNALNVFPVPDGDTGTNMHLTMRAVQEEASKSASPELPAVAAAVARGALMGARGNSGVILSQFFRGLASGLEGLSQAPPQALAKALEAGAAAAYKAVSRPVEGTMLTVIREASCAAVEAASSPAASMETVLKTALAAAQASLARTPELLPVLREAGVVDAGGQGFVLLLEGALRAWQQAPLEAVRLEVTGPAAGRVRDSFLAATAERSYGYCTQLILKGQVLEPDAIRTAMSDLADSTVVVGDETLVKIHVHTFDPGPVISYAVALGSISQVKVDNIDEQHQEFLLARRSELQTAPVAVVAVAWGKGIEALFRNLGAAAIVAGGQTMNPSCQELLAAADSLAARELILLPNNPNIVPTAQQAASLSAKTLRVVPTRSIPQGVAALLSFNPDSTADTSAAAMGRAAAGVQSGEVVTAVRGAHVNGRDVAAGQAMGLLEGDLVAVADEVEAALEATVGAARPPEGALVTLYWGAGVKAHQAEAAAGRLRAAFPGLEVEAVFGGQPHYHYLIAIE